MTNIMYANVLSIKPNFRLGLIADFSFGRMKIITENQSNKI